MDETYQGGGISRREFVQAAGAAGAILLGPSAEGAPANSKVVVVTTSADISIAKPAPLTLGENL